MPSYIRSCICCAEIKIANTYNSTRDSYYYINQVRILQALNNTEQLYCYVSSNIVMQRDNKKIYPPHLQLSSCGHVQLVILSKLKNDLIWILCRQNPIIQLNSNDLFLFMHQKMAMYARYILVFILFLLLSC